MLAINYHFMESYFLKNDSWKASRKGQARPVMRDFGAEAEIQFLQDLFLKGNQSTLTSRMIGAIFKRTMSSSSLPLQVRVVLLCPCCVAPMLMLDCGAIARNCVSKCCTNAGWIVQRSSGLVVGHRSRRHCRGKCGDAIWYESCDAFSQIMQELPF